MFRIVIFYTLFIARDYEQITDNNIKKYFHDRGGFACHMTHREEALLLIETCLINMSICYVELIEQPRDQLSIFMKKLIYNYEVDDYDIHFKDYK